MTTARVPITQSPSGGFVSANMIINEECNFRCVMCDYWRLPHPREMSLDTAREIAPRVLEAGVRRMTITGGEPLMHPQWKEIADLFRHDVPVMRMCSNGLLLHAHGYEVVRRFNQILVSIDGATEETFARVRGVKGCPARLWTALEKVKRARPDMQVDVKMTIMRQNFREICDFVEEGLKRDYIDGVGFGMLDFSFMAFSLQTVDRSRFVQENCFSPDELKELEEIVETFFDRYAALIASNYIFEAELRRFLHRYRSLAGLEEAPPPRRCSIPKNLLIIEPTGDVKACFFLATDYAARELVDRGVGPLVELRRSFDSTRQRVCRGCDQLFFTHSPYEQPTQDRAEEVRAQ